MNIFCEYIHGDGSRRRRAFSAGKYRREGDRVMELKECRKWVARDKEVIAPCQHLSYYDLVVERADGDILTDADGNRYIDFLTSASSLNLGSRNPEVMAAAMEQLGKCTQFTAAYSYNKQMPMELGNFIAN